MSFFCAQPVVDIENVVIVVIIVAFIVSWLTGFCKNAPWIVGAFVSELRVANAIRIEYICSQMLERTKI